MTTCLFGSCQISSPLPISSPSRHLQILTFVIAYQPLDPPLLITSRSDKQDNQQLPQMRLRTKCDHDKDQDRYILEPSPVRASPRAGASLLISSPCDGPHYPMYLYRKQALGSADTTLTWLAWCQWSMTASKPSFLLATSIAPSHPLPFR